MKVGYLGPEGSYSQLACRRLCPQAQHVPYPNFHAAHASAVRGETDACVLPIENSLQGGVLQNLDLLKESPLVATDSYTLRIEHKLIYPEGSKLSDVRRVYSHDQAIGQCSKFLLEVSPDAEVIAVESTAKGVGMIRLPSDACIGGSQLLREGLTAYEGEIADDPNNFTQFLVLQRGCDSWRHTERIFVVAVCENRPGSLAGLLNIMAGHGLDMTKIESRPIKQSHGEYSFFIEFKGDYLSEDIRGALEEMERYCRRLKMIGAY